MTSRRKAYPLERVELMRWIVRIGAVTATALAHRDGTSVVAANARLGRARRDGLLRDHRLLIGRPALYTATAAGVRVAAVTGLDPCRVSVAGAQHLIACAHVAAVLERGYPQYAVTGERELRKRERAARAPLASAVLSRTGERGRLLHRPDLVLWPGPGLPGLPVAVEVELTIKAPRRLAEICRAWARSRNVDGVLYIAPPEVRRALQRAIATAQAEAQIAVVPLESLTSEVHG